MLSRETLERYRRMTTSERAAVFVAAMRQNWPALFEGGEVKFNRRLELIRIRNNEGNNLTLSALARTRSDGT